MKKLSILKTTKRACIYIGYKLSVIALKWALGYKKRQFRSVSFYAKESNLTLFNTALQEEYLKYETESNASLFDSGPIEIIYNSQLSYYTPEAGVFFAPEWIFIHGSEAIYLYVIYCLIGSRRTGIGLRSSIKMSDKRRLATECKFLMRAWIVENKFPLHWISSYEDG